MPMEVGYVPPAEKAPGVTTRSNGPVHAIVQGCYAMVSPRCFSPLVLWGCLALWGMLHAAEPRA